MPTSALIVLIAVFFLTSVIGVVTGSNSLIAVPVMFQVGIEPRAAVATNMFALVFMSVGGAIPFIRQRRVNYGKIWPLVGLTVISSAIGAALVGLISGAGIKLIVTIGMITIAVFTLLRRKAGVEPGEHHSWMTPLTYALVFALGIYGGLFSGGYVTVLTVVCVAIAGMTYSEAVASTKVINVFSSGVATLVFMWQGLVDYRLGVILGVTMFVGAYVGAHYATKFSDIWLRRVFLTTILLLALKTVYDLI
ncbi:MAG: sulfite exporter TauE/SafE family protein [Pyrinomonadaceae bacterium]